MTKKEPHQQYLKRNRAGGVVHLWDGTHTVCRMSKNGGMDMLNYTVVDAVPPNRDLCAFCSPRPKREKL